MVGAGRAVSFIAGASRDGDRGSGELFKVGMTTGEARKLAAASAGRVERGRS